MINIVLTTLAVLFLIEGLFLLLFPKQVKDMCSWFLRRASREKNFILKISVLEIILGLILILIAVLV